MEGSGTSPRQTSFPLMLLPLEVRRVVYTFAVIRVRPIELSINFYGGGIANTSPLSRTRLYAVQDFRMLYTNHEFRKEMTDALYAKNAFDLSLWREEIGEGASLLQIDLSRIRKCRLLLHDLETTTHFPRTHVWGGSFPLYWYHHLQALVASLVFDGHQLDSMLVECERQHPKWLLECLRPMAMLRRFGSIHFRSCHPEVYPYFGFLEARMTSDRAVPFATRQEFRNQTIPWRPDSFSYEARRGSPPRVTDMTGEGVVKSEEEMEAMSRTLYAIIEIGDEMRPQEEL